MAHDRLRLLTPHAKWLSRIGQFGDDAQQSTSEDQLVPDVAAYLSDTNPRLLQLQSLYDQSRRDFAEHTQWCREYVVKGVPLQYFRGDCAYLWQRRDRNAPVHYVSTYYFHKSVPKAAHFLSECTEDSLFGAVMVPIDGHVVTRDKLDSVSELTFIANELAIANDHAINVLDIGSGYGRFAYRMTQCFPNARVICTDGIPESVFLTEFYAAFRGVKSRLMVVPAMEIERALAEGSISLAVAINSLSECSIVAIQWWVERLARSRVPYLFWVPHSAFAGGQQLFSREANPNNRVDVTQVLAGYGYERVCLRPKYSEPQLQSCGVSPTYYHLFRLH